MIRWASVVVLLLCSRNTWGQAVARDPQITAVVQQLFVAMKASDTAATRSAFVANGRVIPMQPGGQAPALGQGLSIDQFVAFVGRNAAGTWVERFWNPAVRISGPLADLWFEYDVYRGATLDHCGVNSVQLQETTTGWKILTMAFTSVTQGCAPHPAPAAGTQLEDN
jgi:hypothetical protein